MDSESKKFVRHNRNLMGGKWQRLDVLLIRFSNQTRYFFKQLPLSFLSRVSVNILLNRKRLSNFLSSDEIVDPGSFLTEIAIKRKKIYFFYFFLKMLFSKAAFFPSKCKLSFFTGNKVLDFQILHFIGCNGNLIGRNCQLFVLFLMLRIFEAIFIAKLLTSFLHPGANRQVFVVISFKM